MTTFWDISQWDWSLVNIIRQFLSVLLGYYLVRIVMVVGNKLIQKMASGVRNQTKSIMIVFGSGGHTTEMLMTYKDYDFSQFDKIIFVRAATDKTSEGKIYDFLQKNNVHTFLQL